MAHPTVLIQLHLVLGTENLLQQVLEHFMVGLILEHQCGTNIYACESGIVTYTGFKGANGYSVCIENNSFLFTYSHVSPDFIVYVGQTVYKGQLIGNVGPKNVYDIPNNPYKDSNGNPTNGATTGPHLHFSIKKDGNAVNPLDYF